MFFGKENRPQFQKGKFFMKTKKVLNIEGEILNSQELERHLEKIATTHNLKSKSDKDTYPVERMLENYETIKQVYNVLSSHVKLKIPIHPAGEWLLDNFYIIEETVKCIQKELTLKRYMNYAGLQNGKYKGFARIYVLAAEIVSYTDCKIDNYVLERSLSAYQTKKNLSMDEIWDIGMFLGHRNVFTNCYNRKIVPNCRSNLCI